MKWTLLGCFFLLSLSTYAHAQAVDQQSELDEEMQVLVRSYVTRHPEVSIDDAITRLTIQTGILHAMEGLRQEFAGRLTEISIQPVPDQHILVELEGSAPVANRTVSTRSGNTKVVFETGHRHTNEAFYALVDKHRELLYRTIPGITGSMGQPGEDRLVIHIEGNEQQAQALQASISELEGVLGLSISLRPNMARSINL
ncbi:hypothetical protein [Stenotrophomonas chelatiphaga]|uniref:hypothetical protein n=1 Tax=Stenotrophomonas chelatiphaga TaxID=517011 RepID=UPI00289DB1EC|nr:hypothetical protein [Stenotrophomonas chelatiphaga]